MGVEWPGYPQIYLIPDVYVGGVVYLRLMGGIILFPPVPLHALPDP